LIISNNRENVRISTLLVFAGPRWKTELKKRMEGNDEMKPTAGLIHFLEENAPGLPHISV
jgi:hypothetical protein